MKAPPDRYREVAVTVFGPVMHMSFDAESARRMAARTRQAHFYRRVYLRCVFALIEGAAFFLKEVLLAGCENSDAGVSAGELAILREKSYNLDAQGRVQERVQYFPVGDNLRFAVAMLNRLFSASVDVGVGGSGWDAFVKCTELRNRLAHPRPRDDIGISDAQLALICRTHDWIDGLLNQCVPVLLPEQDEKQEPNKAPEPTPGPVTGRAGARPAPVPVVAHL